MSAARRSAVITALVALAGATAACSLLVPVDGLNDGAVGGADGGSGNEAAVLSDADEIEDRDTGSNPPASCDGAPCAVPEASTTSFCASRTPADFLCADFDGDLLAGWTGPFGAGGGSVRADDGGSTSPPFSMLAAATRDGGTLPTAGVVKTFSQTVNGFHLELDIELLGDTIFQYVQLALGDYSLIVGTGPSGTQFVQEDARFGDGGTARKIHSFTGPQTNGPWVTGVWHHLVVDAALTAPATVDVKFDGASALAAEPLLYPAVAGAQATLRVGELFVEPGTYASRFDNVVFDPR